MKLTQLLGCRYPLVQGGLAYVGNGVLAGAISAAGGFGQVGSGGRTPQDLAQELSLALDRAGGQPCGVNVPISEHTDCEPIVRVIAEKAKQLRAVSLSAGNPRPYIARFKDMGLRVLVVVSTPEQARKAEAAGADVIVAEGYEAGGHNGPSELTTLTLVPQVARVVGVPVLAAGGIATGAGIAAALMLGAEGVQIGTRFVSTVECQAHTRYKELLITSEGTDTRVIERSVGRVTRVLQSSYVSKILDLEHAGSEWDVLYPLVRGNRNYAAAVKGEVESGWLNCGQDVGLIEDCPTAEELVKRLVIETRSALHKGIATLADFSL